MSGIQSFKNVFNSVPKTGLISLGNVRQNHTHHRFALSRRIVPWYRSLPHPKEKSEQLPKVKLPQNFMKIYPEFLPDPTFEWRNKLREKLERKDMISRRKIMEIPEFYVGSIMAVTVSDLSATDKKNRFVGICIQRGGTGVRAFFTLRNIIDGLGVEIRYEQYCPLLLNIEVLRLEKRLDEELLYLRDCDPIHSTVPMDMQPELIAEGSPVPLNTTVVKLLPEPWRQKYDIKGFKGIELPDNFDEDRILASEAKKPPYYEKFDLMKEYRSTIPEEEQENIFRDISSHYPALKAAERKFRRRKSAS